MYEMTSDVLQQFDFRIEIPKILFTKVNNGENM